MSVCEDDSEDTPQIKIISRFENHENLCFVIKFFYLDDIRFLIESFNREVCLIKIIILAIWIQLIQKSSFFLP